MANVKITALTNLAAGDVAVDDVFIIDDVSVPESKKITVANLRAAVDTIATSNINTVSSNVSTLETSVNTILANVDTVADNVALVGANTVGFASNAHSITATANILPGANNIYSLGSPEAVWQEVHIGPNSLKLGALTISDTGGETITVTGASGAQGNLSTAAVAGVANLTANVVTLESDVDSLQSNTVDLAAGIATLSSVDTATGTETRLNANLDITNDNVASLTTTVDNFGTSSNSNAAALAAGIAGISVDTAAGTETRLNANLDITNDNVSVNFTQLNANISVVQDNVANITDGTTPFSAPVTFTDNVTISGSLIVTGAQVDLGVQSATVDNNFIELSAELGPGDAPATDSGLLINRGNKGNVFIGDHLSEDGVIFVRTQTPDTNTIIAIESFMDLHANALHVASPVNLQRVHFGLRTAEDTGIIIDDTGANINFIVNGGYVANVHYDGSINSQNAIIAPAVFSDGVELQANDSATLFSAYSNDFATYTLINANVDVVQDNIATLTTTVDNFGTSSNSNAAALAAGIATLSSVDTATGTETRLNANLDITNDNVASLTTASDAFGTYANSTFSTIANAASLAAGISGIASSGAFPTGDYGLLDAANSSTDSFGVAVAGLTTFDMKTDPSGSLDTEDLGALT